MRALAFTALLATSGAGLVQDTRDWRFVMDVPQTRAVLVFDASATTSPTPDTRELVVYAYQPVGPGTKGQDYNIVRMTYRYDCKAVTVQRVRAAFFYDEREIEADNEHTPPASPDPSKMHGGLLQPACTGDYSRYPKIAAANPAEERERRFGR